MTPQQAINTAYPGRIGNIKVLFDAEEMPVTHKTVQQLLSSVKKLDKSVEFGWIIEIPQHKVSVPYKLAWEQEAAILLICSIENGVPVPTPESCVAFTGKHPELIARSYIEFLKIKLASEVNQPEPDTQA